MEGLDLLHVPTIFDNVVEEAVASRKTSQLGTGEYGVRTQVDSINGERKPDD
jgi:hypothetical protein